MSMLPDGAETQLDDWTIFFLNQTAFNTISPVLALDTPEVKTTGLMGEPAPTANDKPDLLCVLNLVRTKHDPTLDRYREHFLNDHIIYQFIEVPRCWRWRYALDTPSFRYLRSDLFPLGCNSFIVFQPVLLMALDDYFSDPSQDCLARLFDAVNSMNLSDAPILTRNEKMVMRSSERKDIFSEKFAHLAPPLQSWNNGKTLLQHRSTNSGESFSSFEEGILMRNKEREESNVVSVQQPTAQSSPSEASFSLGGSAVWVGDESGLDVGSDKGEDDSILSFVGSTTVTGTNRRRRSTDASSGSSQAHMKDGMLRPSMAHTPSSYDPHMRSGMGKDTHFYQTTVVYKDHQLPIKMPLATFPEEVGDVGFELPVVGRRLTSLFQYSLITLIKAFSSQALVSGPLHPHLHTNGPQTHPIIILFNALVTGKRIIFLGHRKPAGEVSSFVLSACALGSGCGAVLRGFIERSFPYANLNNRDEWEAVCVFRVFSFSCSSCMDTLGLHTLRELPTQFSSRHRHGIYYSIYLRVPSRWPGIFIARTRLLRVYLWGYRAWCEVRHLAQRHLSEVRKTWSVPGTRRTGRKETLWQRPIITRIISSSKMYVFSAPLRLPVR